MTGKARRENRPETLQTKTVIRSTGLQGIRLKEKEERHKLQIIEDGKAISLILEMKLPRSPNQTLLLIQSAA